MGLSARELGRLWEFSTLLSNLFERRLSDQDLAIRDMTAELRRDVSEGACQRVLLQLLRRIDDRIARIETSIGEEEVAMDHTLFEDANQQISLVINAPGEFGLKIWRRRSRQVWLTAAQVAEIAERMLSFVGQRGPVGSSGHMAAQEPHNGTS